MCVNKHAFKMIMSGFFFFTCPSRVGSCQGGLRMGIGGELAVCPGLKTRGSQKAALSLLKKDWVSKL